jgi:hypothetical protein
MRKKRADIISDPQIRILPDDIAASLRLYPPVVQPASLFRFIADVCGSEWFR